MKNCKLLMLACAMLLVMGSCGNNQNQKEKEDNKTTTVTTTPDLAFFELQGPVKSCISVAAPNGQSFEYVDYDPSGNITLVDGYNPFTLEEPTSEYNEMTSTLEEQCQWSRNDKGQISYFNCEWSGASFTWSNGHVSSIIRPHEDMMYKHELEYDAEGHLVKQTVYGGTDEELEADALALNYMLEYTYLKFDDHGNWTSRMEKWTDYEIDYEDEEEVTRTIEYYE